MTKAEYRSAVRSRTLIREAFLAELEERDLADITVTHVVRRAGVNRSTFYAHYSNISGLLSEFEGEILAMMRSVLADVRFETAFEDPLPFLARAAEHLSADADLYTTLLRARGSERFLGELKAEFTAHMIAGAAVPDTIRRAPWFRLRVDYFAGGLIGLYTGWLLGETPYDLGDITREVARMIRLTGADVADIARRPAAGATPELRA